MRWVPLVLLAACATKAPPYERPETAALLGDGYANAVEIEAPAGRARWWERFGDPATDALVLQALRHNLDLKVAAANLREADARIRAAHGTQLPAVDLNNLAGRGVANTAAGRSYATTVENSVTVSWNADVFGRLRATENVRIAERFATAADRDALVHALIASVVRQRVLISVSQRRLALAESIVASRGQTLDIVNRRYRGGVGGMSAVDVRLARENLATARADLPARRLDIEQAQLALDVLLGRKPGGRTIAPVAMPPVPPLDPPPLGVPAALLDQRPDLAGSEFRILARNHDIEAAVAALYPDLTLRGTLGVRTEDVSKFFTLDRLIADLVGQLATRLFSGGQLEAEIDAAKARLDAQAARYKATVLDAAREVEDALVRERFLRERIDETAARVEHARAAEALARDRYGRGLENLLVVLETERRRRLAEELLLVLQGSLWLARIDLHLALGGDWFSEESA